MNDAVLDAEERLNRETGTFHNDRGGGTPTIDWILFRDDMTVKCSKKVTYHRNGEYPSDHYPVMLDVVLGLSNVKR